MGGCCCSSRRPQLHGTPVYYYVSNYYLKLLPYLSRSYLMPISLTFFESFNLASHGYKTTSLHAEIYVRCGNLLATV